jgi:hypothetical protein
VIRRQELKQLIPLFCTSKCVARWEIGAMRKILRLTLVALVLSGCVAPSRFDDRANHYAQFYKPESLAQPIMHEAPPTGAPRVLRVAKVDMDAYTRQGYVLIGSSSFTSGRPESEQDAIDQGVAVGADLVIILDPEYQGSVTANVPITVPTTTTSTTSGTANIYGSGTPALVYGNATTTTQGTSTTFVPMTVQRSAYAAGYFVKKHYIFGALYRDLNDGERQQLQTNRGEYVGFIIDNSPAYNSDILPGDVIVAINGQTPNGVAGLTELITANRGRAIEVTIVRAGRKLSKNVSLLE